MVDEYLIRVYNRLSSRGMNDGLSLREFLNKMGSAEVQMQIRVYDNLKAKGMNDGKTLEKHLKDK